jgi:hypothetical protein
MKKKLFTLALLTMAASSFAAPISTPNNLSDTPVIGGNGTCGTVDLTNATSDYMLQPCETAVIRFNNQTLVPLHIAVPEPSSPTQPVIYEITVTIYWVSIKNMDIDLYPNNYMYPNQFQFLTYEHGDGGWRRLNLTTNRFYLDTYHGIIDAPPYIGMFKVIYYGANYPKHMVGEAYSNLSISLTTAIWNNTTTQWTSLGTIGVKAETQLDRQLDINEASWQNMSGQIIIKRIS